MLNNIELIRDIIKNVNASNLTSYCDAFITNNLSFIKTARS